jgi:hypothetical protein
MIWTEADLVPHVEDSIRNGDFEMPKPLTQRIKDAYRDNPQASGEEILQEVGAKDTPRTREALMQAQKELRNFTAAERTNHNKKPWCVKQGG